jgi:iron complex transport system ATP-binding protein
MITVEKIHVRYDGRDVLADVSVHLSRGEIIALVGPNGAGKTSLIRAINGSVPLSAGEIRLNGASIRGLSRRQIAREIAVVAQENETKFPVTVLEFVLAGRFVHGGAFGWETEEDIVIARNALRECDLSDFAERLMNELSGGERQRVVLARAVATEARTLLLDEPTANLDLRHQAMMFRLVRHSCKTRGASAIVITHDLNLAAEFADRVILLNKGNIVAIGPPSSVLTMQNISGVFGVDVLLDQNPASGNVRVTTVF